METGGEIPQGSLSRTEGSHKYEVGGTNVAVAWRRFQSTETPAPAETPRAEKAIVYLPGWSIAQQAKSIETLCQTFADYSRDPAYAVDARVDKVTAVSLLQAAEGIREFIQDQALGEVTIVGNSMGGSEAIHLVALLQEKNPNIKINGLILLDSVGLYDQSATEFARSYTRDMVETQMSVAHHPKFREDRKLGSQDRKYLLDGTVETLRELMRSNVRYPGRLLNEIRNMVKTNPDLGAIKVPVVLVQGAHDKLSDPGKIIPNQDPSSWKDSPYIVDIHEREQYLKNTVFTSSPSVRMVVPEKVGHHNVSYSRPISVARSSLYLLERWNRQQSHNRPSEQELTTFNVD